jgi:protocatechuate 3,4-dioxygenase beta subunit
MKRILFSCLAALAAQLCLAAPARAGSVSGRVLDSAGQPVVGAKVLLLTYRDEDQLLLDRTIGKDPVPLGQTATDASGQFRMALEKPGQSVAIRILPAGLPSARFAGPFESSDDTDLADVQIPPSAPLSGRVVDESGKPVAGARVLVIGSDSLAENEARVLVETRTQADGSFSAPEASDGTRVLYVQAAGFVPLTHIQIERKPEERVILRTGGTIRGTIVDSAGKPVAGVIVTADEVAAESDAAGRYEITGVAPGSREVRAVWKEEFAARRENVRVKKGEAVDTPLKLVRAATVTGTVLEEGTRRPVPGARVSAFASAGAPFGRRRAERIGRADTRGRYRVGGLASRPYTIEAARDGYLTSSLQHVAAGIQSAGSANLALRKAASVAGRTVDENGQPVAGARVRVTQELGLRRMMMRGPAAAVASFLNTGALTGPDGAFRLRNLTPARNLEIEAARTGYATARRPGVTLKPGDAVKEVSLVLRKGLEARGRVLDTKGQPVAGAQVRVALHESGARAIRVQMRMLGMDREKPDAITAADGGFLVKGLEEGDYTASVARDGFSRKAVPGLPVKAAGENLWPPISLSPGIALAGLVRDSAGQPIAGAQILGIDPGAGTRPMDTMSGSDGRFRLEGLAADRPLMLNVTAEGYAAVQKNATPPAEDVSIVLKSAGTIRGRVEDADTKKPVTDFSIGRTGPQGGGFFNVQVMMGRGGGDKAFQSDDGSFEVSDVPPGKWTVRATAAGYKPATIAGVEVPEGGARDGVVIPMKRGGTLAGRVIDLRGSVVANASVSWSAAGSGGGGPMGGAFARMAGGGGNTATTTDADGKFSFDSVPDGKVMLTGSHPDYLEVTREVDPSKDGPVDLTLGSGATITGTVVGQDGRSPIPGAQISLDEEGDARVGSEDSARSDGSGNFLFEHLQAGRYKLTAQSNTGKTTSREVAVADGQRADGVLLQMATGTLVNGTVSGLPAGRLGGVRINANGSNYADSTTTDDTGKFTLRDVPSGAIRFNATTGALAGRSTAVSVEIPDGSPQFPVEIVFQGASRLAGRVTRGETPLSGLFVNAFPTGPTASGGGRVSGQTDDNGQYALEGLTDGDYMVGLSGQGVSYRKTFTVSGDSPGDIALPPIQVRGTVTEAGSAEPLDNVTVQAQPQSAPGATGGRGFAQKSAVTDSTGAYFIDDVDSGPYQITARRSEYQAKTQTLTVGGDSATLDFGLQRGEGISIRVGDAMTGVPLKAVTVSAQAADGSVAFQGFVSLDSTGKGEITSLAPGQYTVHLFSDGYAPRTAVLNAPSALVSLGLTPGGRVEVTTPIALSGRLVDDSGRPYPLNAYRPDGRVGGLAPVVSWEHLAPGSYQLLVGPQGGEKPYPFTVAEGQTTRLTVQ